MNDKLKSTHVGHINKSKCDRKVACSKARCLHSGSPAQGQSEMWTSFSCFFQWPAPWLDACTLEYSLHKANASKSLNKVSSLSKRHDPWSQVETWRSSFSFIQLKHTRPPRSKCQQCAMTQSLLINKKTLSYQVRKELIICSPEKPWVTWVKKCQPQYNNSVDRIITQSSL